jgi:hypothetical protein
MDAMNRTLGLQLLIEMAVENQSLQLILLSPQVSIRVGPHMLLTSNEHSENMPQVCITPSLVPVCIAGCECHPQGQGAC